MKKVEFYATKPRDEQKKYEAERLRSIFDDPDRKNVQCYDDGERAKRQKELDAQAPKKGLRGIFSDMDWRDAIAIGGLGAILALILIHGCLKGKTKYEEAQEQREKSRYENFDPALKETYKEWSEEATTGE